MPGTKMIIIHAWIYNDIQCRHDLAPANLQAFIERNTTVMYEDISPNQISTRELDMLNIKANEAYSIKQTLKHRIMTRSMRFT